MADHNGGAVEMRKMGKVVHTSVEYPEEQAAPIGVHGENLESITKIRRLFSFSQLFAFSLTFMSTWEGMNTYVSLVGSKIHANRHQQYVLRPLQRWTSDVR